MSQVAVAFDRAAAEGRAAIIGYLPAGFPSVDAGIEAALAMARSGADIVEIGLPYSDPLMDGPVIQEAEHRALAGGAGLITPDLTPDEADPWLAEAAAHDLDAVFLAAVSSTPERIARIAAACRGFVYAASLMGVTGVRNAVSGDAEDLVGRIREHTTLPVAVGLGVRDGTQAAQVARFADGVIVGSAFVRRLLAAGRPADGIAAVAGLAAELAAAVRLPAA